MPLRALGRRLLGLLARRPVTLWHDPRYRLPLSGVEASAGIEPRRADFAAWWLATSGAVPRQRILVPARLPIAELARVHTPRLLESLGRPEALASIFGVDPGEVAVDELMDTIRLACGGTLEATRETLRSGHPSLNLLGGFHHAGPDAAGGFCPVNDVSVAIASLRADGFRGQVVILDLDAHPPDGLAACHAGDPTVFVGSLSGSDWGPLAEVDETVLPEGCPDDPYLSALDGLLSRAPRPALAYVIAGGDVLAGDRMGRLGLTLRGARRRDLAVSRWLAGVPQVWLPGGGYTRDAWRALAGTGLAIATGSLRPIPPDADPLSSRFAGISAGLSQLELGDSGELTAEDVEEALGLRPERQRLLLGFYTASGMELAFHRYGVFQQLSRLGYADFRVAFDQGGAGERLRLTGVADGQTHVLIEAILEKRRCLGVPVLYIHWLSLRHPRARFSERRPQLPGQEAPGLGLAREAGTMLALMAIRLGLGGVAFRPAHYHSAFTARHAFTFVDPARQGRFEALMRDLADQPLLQATRAVSEGRVLMNGAPYTWEAEEMVYWLRESPAEPGETERERSETTFALAPGPALPLPPCPAAGGPADRPGAG
ncbi:MAG: histone deacetylase [Anaeromyxobacter sp.]|nr:histone deacetylase [Anaeromyxobacter sp.]MBL0277467.1 histone deacetylase [Anaeromyxobacter sp.]